MFSELGSQMAGGDQAAAPESGPAQAGTPRVTPAKVVRLLLVDDHALFRSGLFSVLAPEPDFNVVGQAESVQEALALADRLRPDMVLMDFRLPDGTGVEATRAILAKEPATQIVFLTVNEDDDGLFAAVRAGAQGYLLKSVRAAVLLEQLRNVARGEPAIAPAMALRILKEFASAPAASAPGATEAVDLTAREVEVVRELANGATNREIANRFVISENTVKNHVRNVLAKLHLRNRREVAAFARAHGLVAKTAAAH